MADSFPPDPGADSGSFPHGYTPRPRDGTGDGRAVEAATGLLFRRYRVIRELGRGGMGVVLLAHDTALEIPVAVKLVPDLVVKDTEAIADLRKEVLRGMALNHDGVVRTHHFEKDESGAAVVMEYVEGHTLTELKQQQPGGCFDPGQLIPWIEQLAPVLDYAHREKRLIHRDLKPRNIMLTREGRIKVADFGIAAVLTDSMSRHSMEGKISGTLSYMSPQQAEGRRPDALDDIYALGATLYELLTGKPPFFRGNPASIHAQIFNATPPSMAERREELEVSGRADIPAQWEETIAACLAKDPAARPQSASEVLARLKRPTLGQPARSAVPRPIPPPPGSVPSITARPPALPGPPPLPPESSTRPPQRILSTPVSTGPAPPPLPSAAPPRQHGGSRWAIFGVLIAGTVLGLIWVINSRESPDPTAAAAAPSLAPAPVPTPASQPSSALSNSPSVPAGDPVRLPIGSKLVEHEGYPDFGPPFGYIDHAGSPVIAPRWQSAGYFKDGLAVVGETDPKNRLLQRHGYINFNGSVAIAPQWRRANNFSEGLAAVEQDGKTGYINSLGRMVIQPEWWIAGDFSDGRAVIIERDKRGFIDRNGKLLSTWKLAFPYSEGLAPVSPGTGYGFIDRVGNLVIPATWDDGRSFSEGLASVFKGGKGGFINPSGNLVIPLEWDKARDFSEGWAAVERDGKWGYIDRFGRLVLPLRWEAAFNFAGGIACVREGGKLGFIDRQGTVVVPLEWDGTAWARVSDRQYRLVIKKTSPDKGLARWLDADLREIWRAELPWEKAP